MSAIGNHLCDYCRIANHQLLDLDMTHVDYNSCPVACQVMYYKEWCEVNGKAESDSEDVAVFMPRPGFKGKAANDAEYCPEGLPEVVAFKTEDNGSGYNITRCFCFHFDKRLYRKYLKSDEWKETKEKRLKKDNFQCQMCGTAKDLNVHHITYENVPNEDMSDLVTLCESCHRKVHEKDITNKKGAANETD